MRPRIIILGAGGHGRVVAEAARESGCEVVGFADRRYGQAEVNNPSGFPLLMSDTSLLGAGPPIGVHVCVGLGDNRMRLSASSALAEHCAQAIVHPTAWVSPSASLGKGSVVMACATVNAGAVIGEAVVVNSGAVVEHDCVVEDGAHVSPGAVLAGGVRVGRLGWIGAGAVVIPGVRIGTGALVGAGSVVIRDVPDDARVAGNPARLLEHKVERPR